MELNKLLDEIHELQEAKDLLEFVYGPNWTPTTSGSALS